MHILSQFADVWNYSGKFELSYVSDDVIAYIYWNKYRIMQL